jgi:hypothetical protein
VISPAATTSPVPEPTCLALTGAGILGFIGYLRRRHREMRDAEIYS